MKAARTLVVCLITMLYIVSSFGLTQAAPKDTKAKYEELYAKYNVRDVAVLPEGVQPIPINSPEELEQFILDVKAKTKQPPHKEFKDSLDSTLLRSSTVSPNATGYVTRSCSVPAPGAELTKFVTYGRFEVWSSGSFRQIQSVSTWTALSGFSPGISLSGNGSNYNNRGSSADVFGWGTLDYYLVIEGGVKVWSSPVSCSFTYRLY